MMQDGCSGRGWGLTRSARNQGNVLMLVWRPLVLWKRALEIKPLVDLHAVEVLTHRAVFIAFHEKVEVSPSIFIGDGCVRTKRGFGIGWALVFGEEGSCSTTGDDIEISR